MAQLEERIGMIEEAVLSAAKAESDAIRKKTDDYRRSELDKTEKKVLSELYGRIQTEVSHIHTDSTAGISQHEAHYRQALLQRREELTRQLFTDVAARLHDYAKTPEYTTRLLATAARLAGQYPLQGSRVTFCPLHRNSLADLQKAFGPGCQVVPDDTIKLGGLRLENKAAGLVVDETLDSRLTEQHHWFYANSGMTLR